MVTLKGGDCKLAMCSKCQLARSEFVFRVDKELVLRSARVGNLLYLKYYLVLPKRCLTLYREVYQVDV